MERGDRPLHFQLIESATFLVNKTSIYNFLRIFSSSDRSKNGQDVVFK